MKNEHGQGLIEYTLLVSLIVFTFFVVVKNLNVDLSLSNAWDNIATQLTSPTTGGGAGISGTGGNGGNGQGNNGNGNGNQNTNNNNSGQNNNGNHGNGNNGHHGT